MAFGGGQNSINTGLLGGDFNDPRTQGIMGLATGLLAGGAPQVGRPVSLGGALAQGLNLGMQNFNKAQARQDKLNQGKFQVVGGSLLDLSDPTNPQVVYQQPKKVESGLLGDGKYTYKKDADGNITVQRSSVFDEITAAEKKAKEDAKNNKVLSNKAQGAEDDDFFAIDTSQGILSDIDDYIGMIDGGTLEFGFGEGLKDSLLGFVGAADEEARNSAMFDTFLEKLRNDTLRLNKGVQTEGDAQRALNEIIANKNDTEVVRAQLKRLREINERAVELRKRNINRRRKAQGVDNFDFTDYATPITSDDVGFTVKGTK